MRMADPQMRVRMWSWPMVMRSRNELMAQVMRNQDVAEPSAVPAHSENMAAGRVVSMPKNVKSHSMQTRVPGLVTEIRNPLRASSA